MAKFNINLCLSSLLSLVDYILYFICNILSRFQLKMQKSDVGTETETKTETSKIDHKQDFK